MQYLSLTYVCAQLQHRLGRAKAIGQSSLRCERRRGEGGGGEGGGEGSGDGAAAAKTARRQRRGVRSNGGGVRVCVELFYDYRKWARARRTLNSATLREKSSVSPSNPKAFS